MQKIINLRKKFKVDVSKFYPPLEIVTFNQSDFIGGLIEYCTLLAKPSLVKEKLLLMDKIENQDAIKELQKNIKSLATIKGLIRLGGKNVQIDEAVLISYADGIATDDEAMAEWEKNRNIFNTQDSNKDGQREVKLLTSDFFPEKTLAAFNKEERSWEKYLEFTDIF